MTPEQDTQQGKHKHQQQQKIQQETQRGRLPERRAGNKTVVKSALGNSVTCAESSRNHEQQTKIADGFEELEL
jgi:hypothetical protein